ncbi:MAG TPA: HD domain-containing protein [Planctomycetes bacterium]|nr:HD domain-containing protein [Planctomycetota bacterium]
MSPKQRFSVLRDPVHGDVYLTHEELSVLDTPEMQRLRGVKQLGTAYLAYPGAVHTRFDHSVGVLHMTAGMIEALQRSFEEDPRRTLAVGEREARVVRMAALLHDVTHIPFGHNVEDQTGLFHRHDSAYRFERALAPETRLGARLEELGLRRDVLATLLGDDAVPAYWSQIMSDTICSDILDYLARDAYFTGLRLGVDARVRNYFRIHRASGNLYIDLAKRDLLREDILSEIVRLLEARYYFSERVYYHHAKVAAGALVSRAVELAVRADLVREEDFYDRTDESLLAMLAERAPRAEPALARRIRSMIDRVRERRLPKRACVLPLYANETVQDDLVALALPGRGPKSAERLAARVDLEERIADLVRFATGRELEILLVCPAAHMQLKEAGTHVLWPGESAPRPLSDFTDRVPRLADLERSYRNLWKFYVFATTDEPAVLRKVQEIAMAELPSAENVYSVEGS